MAMKWTQLRPTTSATRPLPKRERREAQPRASSSHATTLATGATPATGCPRRPGIRSMESLRGTFHYSLRLILSRRPACN